MEEFGTPECTMNIVTRKRYVVKHSLITEVNLMTMWWKQLHVSACIGHHQVVYGT